MTQQTFTSSQQTALKALVAQIIPASHTYNQPGADDPDIFSDILKAGAALQPGLAEALASLAGLPAIDRAKAETFRQDYPHEAELIQTLTAQCYYRDSRVLRALNIEPRPPFPAGYVQDPNDFSLLNPVRARGEIYRKTT